MEARRLNIVFELIFSYISQANFLYPLAFSADKKLRNFMAVITLYMTACDIFIRQLKLMNELMTLQEVKDTIGGHRRNRLIKRLFTKVH